MRRAQIVFLLAVLAATALGREMKIAYFDSERIKNEWDEWKDAQAKFDQDIAKWQEEAQRMEEELNSLMEEYQKQELLLSDEKRQEKQMLIQQKQREYQDYLASIFGETGKAAQRNAELTAPLYEKLNSALAKIADRNGYAVIFDSASSGIAYIDPSLDITDELLQELKSGQ